MGLEWADSEVCDLEKELSLVRRELVDKRVAVSVLRRDLRLSLGTGYTARQSPVRNRAGFCTFKPQAEYWNQAAHLDILRGVSGHMVVLLDSPNSEGKVRIVTVSIYL